LRLDDRFAAVDGQRRDPARPLAGALAPIIGDEAAGLNTRAVAWHMRTVLLGFAWLVLAVWSQLESDALSVLMALVMAAGVVFAFARWNWLAHRTAQAANRHLSARLGFPVRLGRESGNVARWRRSIEREIARHARETGAEAQASSWSEPGGSGGSRGSRETDTAGDGGAGS
jgi:hypothetical protein